MKRLLTALLSAALLISMTTAAFAGFDGFESSGLYTPGLFSDVGDNEWYSGYVGEAYNRGLLQGKGDDIFDPGGTLTYGEAVTLAARLHNAFHAGGEKFPASNPFYKVYADYALKYGIIPEHGDYTVNATRAQVALLFRNALPETVFNEINKIPDNGICDVTGNDTGSDAIYTLYRAGVTVGSDLYGTYYPDSSVTRAETCAMLTRIIDSSYRIRVALPKSLPAEAVYERNADAVFMIETFDEAGNTIRYGSGFFISADGLAVTNDHVVAGAKTAIVTLNDERKYLVTGVLATDPLIDLSVLQVELEDERTAYLHIADSDALVVGATVYAFGSPLELLNSISAGLVAYVNREVGSQIFFQFTAAISFGSGGGPVVNSLGQVVGVSSSSFTDGQRLNLAIPINLLNELEYGESVALSDMNW